MPADHSRYRHDPTRRYVSVRMQQGRVQLDSDWNEESDIARELTRKLAIDVRGNAFVGQETPDAFLIGLLAGPPANLSLGEGRMWVDGRRAEILPGEGVTYLSQPFLPDPAPVPAATEAIVYLDLFERDVTHVEDSGLIDVALGGLDTTSRIQQVWQVRVHPLRGAAAACGVEMDALFPASAGRLTTAANAPPAPDDPCIVPPVAGYRGIENRLYRVEIQVGGPLGTARFKWSRDNGSIVSRVTGIAVAGGQTRVQVTRIGRDEVLRFRIGDWVTLTDEHRDLAGEAGEMARVADIDEALGIVVLDRVLPAAGGRTFAADAAGHAARATRLQRWDQQAPTNTLDADGLMTVAAGPIPLEDGVELRFSVAGAGGTFHIGDWWVFAARTADASVEVLTAAPPRGRRHRYVQLAAISASGAVADCRPRDRAGVGCCTFVVAPGEDIQAAIDALPPAGGCICLKAGTHVLRAALRIGRDNVHLHGESLGAVVVNPQSNAVLVVERAMGTRVEMIDWRGEGRDEFPMIALLGAIDTRIADCRLRIREAIGLVGIMAQRCDELVLEELALAGIARGVLIGPSTTDVAIRDCHLVMPEPERGVGETVGIAAVGARDLLVIDRCRIESAMSGIILNDDADNPVSRLTAPLVRDNIITLLAADQQDWRAHGIDCAAPGAQVTGNLIGFVGGNVTGIRLAGRDSRASDNHIVSRARSPGIEIGISAGRATEGPPVDGISLFDNELDGALHAIACGRLTRGRISGNRMGRIDQPMGFGILLVECADCTVADNDLAGMAWGAATFNGGRNRLAANRIAGGQRAMVLLNETAGVVEGNRILDGEDAAITAVGLAQGLVIRGNQIARCGFGTRRALGIAVMGVLGELVVAENEVLDIGERNGQPGSAAAPLAQAIFGAYVQQARIEGNRVAWTEPQARPPGAEDRALLIQGYIEAVMAETTLGFPLLVADNDFSGCGRSALVEVVEQPISDNVISRFERVLYSGNHHLHFNTRGQDGVTVRLTGRALTVSGNQVKAILRGAPSWHLGGRPGPFIGNVSAGGVADRAAAGQQFPSPASAFNLIV